MFAGMMNQNGRQQLLFWVFEWMTTMAEYIERQAAKDAFGRMDTVIGKTTSMVIDSVPAADVAPVVHGRWIYDGGNEYVDHYHCDRCGQEIDLCNEIYTEPKPNYCGNCGAKMDKEADDAR